MVPWSQEELYQDRSYENVGNWGEEAAENKKVEDKGKLTKNDLLVALYSVSYLLPQSQHSGQHSGVQCLLSG